MTVFCPAKSRDSLPARLLRDPKRRSAFTLPEVLITLAVSVLISIAVVASQLYGIRMTELTQTKIHTNDKARQLMRLLSADIQASRLIRVGTGSSTSFTPAAPETPQEGNALQIYTSDDTNVFVRYFRAGSDLKLKRMKSDGAIAEIASGVANDNVFAAEDPFGQVLTAHQHHTIIAIDLQFSQLENPDLPVGPQHHYKSYRFRARLAQPKIL